MHPTSQTIRGYGGSIIQAKGVVHFTLTVDLVTADVEAYVVDDEVQTVPVIVGQSFFNRANVTMVLRDDRIRVFENHLAVLPGVDILPPPKLELCATNSVVIPPRTIGFVEVCSPAGDGRDVYVEAADRQQPGHEYNVSGCITTDGGVISIRNLADVDLEIPMGQLLVRGVPCTQGEVADEVSILSIQTNGQIPFQLADIHNLVGPELGQRRREEVLGLINEF
jgi:hypothetical protein